MATGIVKFFNAKKGWGFIGPDGADKDIFVHYSSIEMEGFKELKEGDRVEFTVIDGEKGKQTENVKKI